MPEFADPEISLGREEESLFARDDNDVLVRREKETRDRFNQMVKVVIDGYEVEVPRAVPKTDSQGNPLRDTDGELVPRTTTIHDAAAQLVAEGIWTEEELKVRIPVLCHQRHVAPVAVCRMCSVHISSMKRGKLTPSRKLVPACQHKVDTGMVVTTRAGMDGYNPETKAQAETKVIERASADVNDSVKMLAEFLVADHCHAPLTGTKRYEDELTTVARSLDVVQGPGGRPGVQGAPRACAATRRCPAATSRSRHQPEVAPRAAAPGPHRGRAGAAGPRRTARGKSGTRKWTRTTRTRPAPWSSITTGASCATGACGPVRK